MTEFKVSTTIDPRKPYGSLVIESNDMQDDIWQLEHSREYGRMAFSIEISYKTAEKLIDLINNETIAAHGRYAMKRS